MSTMTSTSWQSVNGEAAATADLKAFFGSSALPYLATYRALTENPGRFLVRGWSWAILIGSFAWFFYRKCYAIGAVALAVPAMLSVLHYDTLATLVPVGFAVYGKSLYVQSALVHIRRADELDLDGHERSEFLRLAGGVSILGGAIGVVLYVTLLAIMAIRIQGIPSLI
jgi:hypothetical protein